jgi:hypothetical protein
MSKASPARQFGMRSSHWLYGERSEEFGPVFAPGVKATKMRDFRRRIEAAARHAIKAATDNGRILDFDPDAMVIEFTNAVCGPCADLCRAIDDSERAN